MNEKGKKKRTYEIVYRNKYYKISITEDAWGRIVNEFRPAQLIGPVKKDRIENEEEFLLIWIKYIIGLSVCEEVNRDVERHIGALTLMTIDHIEQYGEIDMGTLLKFTDCFAIGLSSENREVSQIKKIYSQVIKIMLDFFHKKVTGRSVRAIERKQ